MEEEYIFVQCDNCGKRYKVKNPENPKRYRCGNCQNPIIVEPRLTKVYEDNSKQLYLRTKNNGKKHIGPRNTISLLASHLKFWDRVIISFIMCFIIFIGFIWLTSKFIQKPSSPALITNLEKSISKPSSSVTKEKPSLTKNENKKLQEGRSQSKLVGQTKEYFIAGSYGEAALINREVDGTVFIGEIPVGTKIQILEKKKIRQYFHTGDYYVTWYRVSYNGIDGWVSEYCTTGDIISEKAEVIKPARETGEMDWVDPEKHDQKTDEFIAKRNFGCWVEDGTFYAKKKLDMTAFAIYMDQRKKLADALRMVDDGRIKSCTQASAIVLERYDPLVFVQILGIGNVWIYQTYLHCE